MSGADRSPVVAALAERIRRHGPVRFDEVMEAALYDAAGGFFAAGGRAGARGADFLTSPEVGPLFGAVVAGALDRWWRELGEPDPFVVVEGGAGTGTLARSVLAAGPACGPALSYVLVERSAPLRAHHGNHLPLMPATHGLPPSAGDDEAPPERGTGPRFVSLAELPVLRVQGVVLANELLDNLPFRVLERSAGGWREVRVALAPDGERLTEVVTGLDDRTTAQVSELAPEAPVGARVPWQEAAVRWVVDATSLLLAGRVVVIDYMAPTAELARRWVADPGRGWLRTYRAHAPGPGALDDLGAQDITADVALDQIARAHPPVLVQTQAHFLADGGIDELVAAGRRIWHERAHLGDLEAIRGRSRVREAEALLDPTGLGAFTVAHWAVG